MKFNAALKAMKLFSLRCVDVGFILHGSRLEDEAYNVQFADAMTFMQNCNLFNGNGKNTKLKNA